MILDAISSLELKAVNSICEEEKRIDALLRIRQHLSQIDFEMEEVPLVNAHKLKSLIEFLKGDKLDDGEAGIIGELIINADSNKSGNKPRNLNIEEVEVAYDIVK